MTDNSETHRHTKREVEEGWGRMEMLGVEESPCDLRERQNPGRQKFCNVTKKGRDERKGMENLPFSWVSAVPEDNSIHHLHTIPPTRQKGFFFFFFTFLPPLLRETTGRKSTSRSISPNMAIPALFTWSCEVMGVTTVISYLRAIYFMARPQTGASQYRWTA